MMKTKIILLECYIHKELRDKDILSTCLLNFKKLYKYSDFLK